MANQGKWIDTCPKCGGENLRATVRTTATYNIRNECAFQTWAHHETDHDGETEWIDCMDCGEQWGPGEFDFDSEGNLVGLHEQNEEAASDV